MELNGMEPPFSLVFADCTHSKYFCPFHPIIQYLWSTRLSLQLSLHQKGLRVTTVLLWTLSCISFVGKYFTHTTLIKHSKSFCLDMLTCHTSKVMFLSLFIKFQACFEVYPMLQYASKCAVICRTLWHGFCTKCSSLALSIYPCLGVAQALHSLD